MSQDKIPSSQITYFEDEMKTSYLNYAYSVITSRAIPDARDGLKPVHRRILYAMLELGLRSDKPTRKSARVVGDVLGKYHPHGDSSVYMAAVKLTQEFSIRYPLLLGQGNFGSIDDDPPAAMRYTEMKLAPLAEQLLQDIDRETVDFRPNFDDTLEEPKVFPGLFPQLLCNGGTGIAVGFATDIPPHHLSEVTSAISALVANPNMDLDALMEHIPGPDFPTGGFVTNQAVLRDIYATGQGSIQLAGVIQREQAGRRDSLVISEIPYRIVKSRLVEDLNTLVFDNKDKFGNFFSRVKDIRDESNKEGIRIVIDLLPDADVEAIKSLLYQHSALSSKIKVNMVALVDNQPRLLPLKDMLQLYIRHRREVVTRRTEFDLAKARARLLIVLALIQALARIEEVIAIIRGSKDAKLAREQLMAQLVLDETQAQAILDMRLQRLTSLEVQKLQEEERELHARIQELSEILANDAKRDQKMLSELVEVAEALHPKNPRRTQFQSLQVEKVDQTELIKNEPLILALSRQGWLFREVGADFESNVRGGRGKKDSALDPKHLADGDSFFITLSGHMKDHLLVVTNAGRVYSMRGFEITGNTQGRVTRTHIQNMARLNAIVERKESITAALLLPSFPLESTLLFLTAKGKILRTPLSGFEGVSRAGIFGMKLSAGDEVVSAVVGSGTANLLVVKSGGKGFRICEDQVSIQGRNTQGSLLTKCDAQDTVLGMDIADPEKRILVVSPDGRGRALEMSEVNIVQNRGAKGFMLANLGHAAGNKRSLVGFVLFDASSNVMLLSAQGKRMILPAHSIENKLLSLVKLSAQDQICALSALPDLPSASQDQE